MLTSPDELFMCSWTLGEKRFAPLATQNNAEDPAFDACSWWNASWLLRKGDLSYKNWTVSLVHLLGQHRILKRRKLEREGRIRFLPCNPSPREYYMQILFHQLKLLATASFYMLLCRNFQCILCSMSVRYTSGRKCRPRFYWKGSMMKNGNM